MTDFVTRRARMVAEQIAGRGLDDPRILDAMAQVPRERFVPEDVRAEAFADGPLPIGQRQTISQPYVVALMAEAAAVKPGDRVLEVGAGSGYGAAVLAQLGAEVFAIERHADLAAEAAARLSALGFDRVTVRAGDGSLGWPEAAPFDAIVATASGPAIPEALRGQLRLGGRLVIPIGDRAGGQRLIVATRTGETAFEERAIAPVSFVPLVGAQGWDG